MEKYILLRIKSIQRELDELRKILERQVEGKPLRQTKIKGLWAGLEVTDEELEEAKREVFRDAYKLKE
ncbi:MAG: hypothetical protein GDA38_18010 [Hormoscilla sp. SP12CHS1]|nr:hypothetical protein [Hormoscilla sp. SP12CHS1]